MKQAFVGLALLGLAACQSQPPDTAEQAPVRPAAAPVPAFGAAAPDSNALNWLASYVDTLPSKSALKLPLQPATRAAFDRLPAALADTSESSCLRAAGNQVRRRGNLLRLPLCNDTLVLRTNDETEDPDSSVRYAFVGTLPGANQWPIATGIWEGFYYLLVDKCSGRRQYAWNYPVPSPDRRYFITANSDLEAQYTATGMQLWAVTAGGGVRKIWQREWPGNVESGPAEVRWLNAYTVLIREEFLLDAKPSRYVSLNLNTLMQGRKPAER